MEEKKCTCIIEEDFAIMGVFAGCPVHSLSKLKSEYGKKNKN